MRGECVVRAELVRVCGESRACACESLCVVRAELVRVRGESSACAW